MTPRKSPSCCDSTRAYAIHGMTLGARPGTVRCVDHPYRDWLDCDWLAGAKGLLIGQRFFLLGDDFTFTRFRLGGVEFDVALPLFRNVVFVKDCFDGAFRNARFAIDTLFGVDVEHLISLVEALYGANDDAIGVFASRARLGNNVSHVLDLSNQFKCGGIMGQP